jgi:hypothetical protein
MKYDVSRQLLYSVLNEAFRMYVYCRLQPTLLLLYVQDCNVEHFKLLFERQACMDLYFVGNRHIGMAASNVFHLCHSTAYLSVGVA